MMLTKPDSSIFKVGGCQNGLDYGKYFTTGYAAAVLLVLKKVCYHLSKLFCKVYICLLNLTKSVIDSPHHFGVRVFLEAAIGLYDFKLCLRHHLFASLQNLPIKERLPAAGFSFANYLTDFLNQFSRIPEVTIDTCKANICHLVNSA